MSEGAAAAAAATLMVHRARRDLQDGFSPRLDFQGCPPERTKDHDGDDDDDDEGASMRFFFFFSLLRLQIGYLIELIFVIITPISLTSLVYRRGE